MESCSPPFIDQQEKTEQEKNLRQRIEGKNREVRHPKIQGNKMFQEESRSIAAG